MELTDPDLQWAREAIKKTGFFSTCTEAEVQLLLAGLEKKEYHAGQTILFQGEISCRLCWVQEGAVSIWVQKGKGKNKIADLGPNSFFGEISLLTPRAATATVKADNDTSIIFLPGMTVQCIVGNNPVLSEIINKKIEERLSAQKKNFEDK